MLGKAARACSIVLALASFTGCADLEPDEPDGSGSIDEEIQREDQAGPSTALPEGVQLLNGNGYDFCSGVLVSPRLVLTAAHCLGGDHWTVQAQRAPGKPKASGTRMKTLPGKYWRNPAAHDIGVIVLDTPIHLAHYAKLTTIGPAADRGRTFRGVAVGRAREGRNAGLVRSKVMTIRSARDDGYTTGLRTQFYSFGGDSGGPLFLVEDGKITHRLVGIERQPEPSRDADYFTRIDDDVIALVDGLR